MSAISITGAQAEALHRAARRFGTPAYVTDLEVMAGAARAVSAAFPDPWLRAFSVKANDVPAVIAAVAAHGFAANVVSRGEWAAATRAGLPNERVTLEGVGKTAADLRAAARAAHAGRPLRWVAIESPEEAADLADLVRRAGRNGPRLDVLYRFNPDVTPETLPGLAVGAGGSKFGMTESEIATAIEAGGGPDGPLRPRGIHLHVGSQLGAVDAWRDAVRRAVAVTALWRGSIADFDTLDLGGGFPVFAAGEPAPSPQRFAREIPALLEAVPSDRRPFRLAIEPGRFLVARAGFLVAAVLHVRERGGRQVVLDAGMTELIRPALYGARHPIVALTSLGRPVDPDAIGNGEPAHVEGPICESTDSLGIHELPPLARGDLVAIADAGAYAASQSSTYNGRPRPPRSFSSPMGRCCSVVAAGRCDAAGQSRPQLPVYAPADVSSIDSVPSRRRSGGVHPRPPRRSRRGREPAGPASRPSFPSPVNGQAVYDFAGILSPAERERAEATIDNIKARTAAEVVVYTQDSGTYPSADETEAKARALIDQWGVGRKGFNDGMAIFFDMQPNLEHGQVQMYAAPGFESAYLSNDERQSIGENDMLPFLKEGDFDGALDAALTKVDAAATSEHAAELQTSRQFNAVLGLVGAPIVFMGLVGWVFFAWRRYGKDPVYLDDPSVLMPAPPPDLTAASGALVMEGETSRRALTTAMLDLASRGQIAFRQEQTGLLHHTTKVGIDLAPGRGDEAVEAQRRLNARRPTGPAEAAALEGLKDVAQGDVVPSEDLPKFGAHVAEFDRALEDHVVDKGWFANKPSAMVKRWASSGAVAILAGGGLWYVGANFPMSGLVLIGIAAIAGGVVIVLFSRFMPAVTMSGAMVRAMLAAYRRTLEKTMRQARSMEEVVDQSRLPWLETPDQAVVWGTALGLQSLIEDVLKRSLEDVKAGAAASAPYFPVWYQNSHGASFLGAGAGGVSGSGGGLFSDSGIPDIGGMMSSLGTIGNSPSSSGGGGGGFGGGSSGGGGGGAGVGF